jgi:copper(I)-binding protein
VSGRIAALLLSVLCTVWISPAAASADLISMERRIIVAGGEPGGSAAAYAIFVNAGKASRIVEAQCECAEKIELHKVDRDSAGGAMALAWPLELPAGARTAVSPPGIPQHLMVVGLKAPIEAGGTVSIRFRLESGEWISGIFDAVESSVAAWREFDQIDLGIAQLRHSVGKWDVSTTFFGPNGIAAAKVDGSYEFDWVIVDRLVRGTSTIPALGLTSGLLFYVRPSGKVIEMLSVGSDGMAWTMAGPIGGEVRETPVVIMSDGSSLKLRFTRFNITNDQFESRMERSTDGGVTWSAGNHQKFVRRKGN